MSEATALRIGLTPAERGTLPPASTHQHQRADARRPIPHEAVFDAKVAVRFVSAPAVLVHHDAHEIRHRAVAAGCAVGLDQSGDAVLQTYSRRGAILSCAQMRPHMKPHISI